MERTRARSSDRRTDRQGHSAVGRTGGSVERIAPVGRDAWRAVPWLGRGLTARLCGRCCSAWTPSVRTAWRSAASPWRRGRCRCAPFVSGWPGRWPGAHRRPAPRSWVCGSPRRVGVAGGLDKDGQGVAGVAVAGVRVHRGRHGHRAGAARQPAAATVPGAGRRGPSSTAWGSTTAGRQRWPHGWRRWVRCRCRWGSASASPRSRRWRRRSTTTWCRCGGCTGFADYIAINVSSPNTPGLRSLQGADALRGLLDALVTTSESLSRDDGRSVPLVVKVAPDLTSSALDELLGVCLDHGVAGIIAANTTLDRGVLTPGQAVASEAGGLSGWPPLPPALEVVRQVRAQVGDRLAVIGVGGVRSAGRRPAHGRCRRGPGAALHGPGLRGAGPGAPHRAGPGRRRSSGGAAVRRAPGGCRASQVGKPRARRAQPLRMGVGRRSGEAWLPHDLDNRREAEA